MALPGRNFQLTNEGQDTLEAFRPDAQLPLTRLVSLVHLFTHVAYTFQEAYEGACEHLAVDDVVPVVAAHAQELGSAEAGSADTTPARGIETKTKAAAAMLAAIRRIFIDVS